jgi:prenyltransferase beta subunit
VKATLAFIAKLRDSETGAYAVNPPKEGEKPKPSLRAVNGAVKAIKYLGGELTDKEKLTKFVLSCYDDKAGTFAEPGGKPDVAITSVGVMAAVELGIPKEKYKKAMEYLGANAKTFEEVRIAAAAVEAVGLLECGIDTKPWVKEAFGTLNTAADARDAGGAVAAVLRLRPGGVLDDAKKECLQLIHDGRRPDGGWGKKDTKASDAETTYRVMRALMMLKEKPKDTAGLKKFLASCRRTDGGYGVDATAPSSMSGVYYHAVVTKWLTEMEK